MIGDNAKRSIIDNSREKKWQKRALTRMDSKPLGLGDNPATNPDCCMTSGAYTVKYKPIPDNDQFADRPYVIKCDLFAGNRIRFKNLGDLNKMAYSISKVKWLLENTTFDQRMLAIAKLHPDTPIPFVLDVVKYEKRLKAQGDTNWSFLWEVKEHGDIERVD